MHKTLFHIALFAVVVVTAITQARAADDQHAASEQQRQLIQVLQSDASKADKAITCKRLAIHGTAEAVPALAPLLLDAELASWARIALEAIPDPAASDALRAAMGKLDGRLLIGVINSLAVRHDVKAVDGLNTRLKDVDPKVASAAAVALGHIGNAEATKILEQTLSSAPAAVRSAVAEGCILCAEKLLAEGKAAAAAKLYDQVRQADVPKQRILEGIRGAIIARKSDGIPLLVEQLELADKARFAIGLSTARELEGPEVTKALVAQLSKVSPYRQSLLIFALADRGDTAALPAVLRIASSGPKQARIAAIDVLKRLGDKSCLPALLDIATEADPEVALTAKAALESLPGDEVDADLVARLAKAEGKMRRVLIGLVGLRRIAAAAALLEAANDPDPRIRSAALTALGEVVQLKDLPVLITRVVAPRNIEDRQAAEQALRVACVRMPDREACAAKLAAAMSEAPVSAKCTILETLSAMGGAEALRTVGAAANDPNPELQDAASRLLGGWMTVDAAPVLLELAKNATDKKYQIRALRGYIRIVRQFNVPDQQRTEMCRMALQAAQRDDEKKLVLEVLKRYPSVGTLRLAVETAKVPSLKNHATEASLAIAQKIGGSAGVRKLLDQIGRDPVKVEIIKAEYGAGTTFKDVTKAVRKYVRDFPLIALPSSSYNSSFGGDPLPGVKKRLKIQYQLDGKAGEVSFPENATILLPIPK